MYMKAFTGNDETIFDSTGKIYFCTSWTVHQLVDADTVLRISISNMGSAK